MAHLSLVVASGRGVRPSRKKSEEPAFRRNESLLFGKIIRESSSSYCWLLIDTSIRHSGHFSVVR